MKHKNFQAHQQDPFPKNAQGISKIYHDLILLMKFLLTKPSIKNLNNNYYDLYYIVFKIRYEIKNIDNQFENDDTDHIDINDFINPNQYFGIKPRESILK